MRIGDRRQNEQSHPSSPQNTRRYMLSKFVQGSTTTVAALLLAGRPQPAAAVYGVDAKMSFPDPIQGLADRNGKQCLVESLGNRECLVYR